MKNVEQKSGLRLFNHSIGLFRHLEALDVEDVLSSVVPQIQSRYAAKMATFAILWDRLRRVQRRRPLIYFDFKKRNLFRRGRRPERLPVTLAISVLAWLFRNASINVVDFHLLPRNKQRLDGTGKGKLRAAFPVEISKLRRFITRNNLPIEIIPSATRNCCKLGTYYVRSNIHQARELAECAQHQFELADYERAAVLAEQALRIDPDCRLAASVVCKLIGSYPINSLYGSAVRAQSCWTRDLLAITNTIDRISARKTDDKVAGEIIAEAHRRVTSLQRHLQKPWVWLERSDTAGADPYAKVLRLIGQAALAKVGRAHLSFDDAFRQLIDHPSISETIYDVACAISPKNTAYIAGEVQVRFWRLLFVDGWLPVAADIEGFVEAIRHAIRTRLRLSNTPEGAGKTSGVEYRDEWYRNEEHDTDPESSI